MWFEFSYVCHDAVQILPILVHIDIEILLQYNTKQGYIHKFLKKIGVYSQGQNCLF